METRTFRPSIWKAALLLLLTASLAAGAAWVALFGPDMRIAERAVCWLAFAVFGYGAGAAARRLAAQPAIEISAWGVRDFRQNIAAPWDKIKHVRVWWDEFDAAHTPWIALDVDARDIESVFVNQDYIAQKARMADRVLLHPDVALKTQGLPGAYRQVLAAIKARRPDLVD